MCTNMREKIPWAKPSLWGNEKDYVLDAVSSTWISGGQYVDKLETEFARINGSKYAVTTSNGTTALSLALISLGIKAGDEVIVPGFCFVAAGNTVIQLGAKAIYADVDGETWNINPVEIEKKITNKTKAILVVHNYGNICDMEPIVKIAKKNNIYLIEDVAEAPFTKYKGKSAGTFGDLGCFSFQATKTITTGEGGAVITDNPELEKKMRKIRSHGLSARGRYWHDEIGYNFRLTNVQAAIGVAQLEKLDIILKNKKRIYDLYKKNLSGIDGIAFQKITHGSEPIIWAVAVKINQEKFRVSRDEMIDKLLEKNIETRPGFYPFHAMPLYNTDVLPMADEISKNIISLPSFAALKDEEIEYICNSLKSMIR